VLGRDTAAVHDGLTRACRDERVEDGEGYSRNGSKDLGRYATETFTSEKPRLNSGVRPPFSNVISSAN
jgi:hypothetical protein